MKNIPLYSHIKDIADLPLDKVIQMRVETAKIKRKHPGWGPKKVAKTVAKKFGLKLVNDEKFDK